MAPMPNTGATPAARDAEGSNRLRNEGVRNFGNQRRMISELERINALNLEPSLPKQEDGNRNVSRLSQNRDMLKNEFQQFLKGLQATDNKKPGAAPASQGSGGGNATSAGSMPPQSSNPQVQVAKQQNQGNVSQSTNPPFLVTKISNSDGKTLGNILDAMLNQASSAAPDKVSPDWPEAQGPSFHDVLGEPQPGMPGMNPAAISPGDQQQGGGPRPVPPQQSMPGAPAPQGNPRQPPQGPTDQAQMRPMVQPNGPQAPGPGQHPQAMPPQGYVMAQAGPPGQVGPGGQPQMQMFPMQGMGPGGPQNMQPIQGMQMQGQNMIMMGNQMMMAPNQQMAVPMGMMAPAPGPGGQMPQGMGISPMPQMQGVGGDQQQQQQQQMMYVPMMISPDGGAFMPQQGMPQQPYPQQGGQPGNPQQPGPYAMMQQPMFHQQPPDNRHMPPQS